MRLVRGTAVVDRLSGFLDALDAVARETDCTVQAFDARYVTGPAHLRQALRLADRAFDRGENVARDRGVELLVYAAARRQIDDALQMGVSEGTTPVVVCVVGDPDDSVTPEGETEATAESSADRDRATAEPPEDRERRAADRVADLVRDARHVESDDDWDGTDPERVQSFFDVTDRELSATDGTLADVVRERVALFAVEK